MVHSAEISVLSRHELGMGVNHKPQFFWNVKSMYRGELPQIKRRAAARERPMLLIEKTSFFLIERMIIAYDRTLIKMNC
jgi:hypothetical protein